MGVPKGFKWSAEKRLALSEARKRDHQARRARFASESDTGLPLGGRGGVGGRGGDSRRDDRRSGGGGNRIFGNLPGRRVDEPEEEPAPEIEIDVEKIKGLGPRVLMMLVSCADELIRWLNPVKKEMELYFEPVEKDEAKEWFEFIWPFLASWFPDWLKKHYILSACVAPIGLLISKFRARRVTKTNGTPGSPDYIPPQGAAHVETDQEKK